MRITIIILPLLLFGGLSVSAFDKQEADTLQEVGYIIQQKVDAPVNSVFDVVEQMPSFPGGNGGLMEFLASNIHYPKAAEEKGIEGRVICTFVVEKDGTVNDIKVVQNVDPFLDKEAKRVIKSMPKWAPGYQKGQPVRVRYTLPLTFSLNRKNAVQITSWNSSNSKKISLKNNSIQNSLIGQLLSFHKYLVTNKVEKNLNNEYELNYYNDDCIDYILVRNTDRIYPLHEGKNTLFKVNDRIQMNDPSKKVQDIRLYPGKFIDEKKLDKIVYAMPVENGKKTQCVVKTQYYGKDSVDIQCFYFKMQPRDTIYAARSGMVCPDVVNDRLFIYHDDGTIALYTNIQKFVKHQDRVVAGQPIGMIIDGKYSLRLSILYLSEKRLNDTDGRTFPYVSYSPMFRTTSGDVSFEDRTTLTPKTDDALRMQEMTSKEKKKLMGK